MARPAESQLSLISFPIVLLSLITALPLLVRAQSNPAATIYQPSTGWDYHGCFNETTTVNGTGGLRALYGIEETLTTMTVPICLAYCQSNSYSFAGLEYTRECYCANMLSALANKLPDSSCDLVCQGNDTQICGGNLKLTVYQANSGKGNAASVLRPNLIGVDKGRGISGMGSLLALGVAVAGLMCLA